jgi:TolB-like protein
MTTAPDIFLSYSRDDQARAKLFAEAFEREGFKVWWDVGLRAGEAYDTVTETALKTAKAVVVLWSKRSVESRWVRAEATLADRNKTLVPAMIEACERPIMFELTQTAELMHWQGDAGDAAFQSFLADVRRFVRGELNVSGIVSRPPDVAVAGDKSGLPLVVVLPFANRSPVHDDSVFATALLEELTFALSASRVLRVISAPPLSSHPAGDTLAVETIRALGVRYIVRGSVMRSGSNVRVRAQLVDAASGAILWGNRHECPTSCLLEQVDELVISIVGHIDAQIERLEDQGLPDASGEAELPVLLRRVHKNLIGWRNELAVSEAERAVALAPRSARAHAKLAAASGALFTIGGGETFRERALVHADKALKLDGLDRDVVADAARSFICVGEAARGVAMLEKGLSAMPDDAEIIGSLVMGYLMLDRLAEALAAVDSFRQRRPFSSMLPNLSMSETMVLIKAGDYAAARSAAEAGFRHGAVFPPQLLYHALACARLGDDQQARLSLRRARKLGKKRFRREQIRHAIKLYFAPQPVTRSLEEDLDRLWMETEADTDA